MEVEGDLIRTEEIQEIRVHTEEMRENRAHREEQETREDVVRRGKMLMSARKPFIFVVIRTHIRDSVRPRENVVICVER
jgi:hypothetical protein